jgi:hypothetical protein
VVESQAVSPVRKPLFLALLSLVMASLFVCGLIYLGVGSSEGGLTWLSPTIKEKLDTACGILLWPGTRIGSGLIMLAADAVFYAILIFVAISLSLRRR